MCTKYLYPILIFCLLSKHYYVWNFIMYNSCHVHNILLLQKKAIRVITRSSHRAHCKPLFSQEKILTVINLYIYCFNLHKKEVTRARTINGIHSHNTRNSCNIYIPYHRLSKSLSNY
jgi:hypothetical protein